MVGTPTLKRVRQASAGARRDGLRSPFLRGRMLPSHDSSAWAAGRYQDRLHRDLRNGAVAGLLGGGSIMILFLAYDAFSFGPLATPDLLAEAITGQKILALDFPAPLRVARIMVFTVPHLEVKEWARSMGPTIFEGPREVRAIR